MTYRVHITTSKGKNVYKDFKSVRNAFDYKDSVIEYGDTVTFINAVEIRQIVWEKEQ